jgi:hypothetical protein
LVALKGQRWLAVLAARHNHGVTAAQFPAGKRLTRIIGSAFELRPDGLLSRIDVGTENLSSGIVVVKSAKDGV